MSSSDDAGSAIHDKKKHIFKNAASINVQNIILNLFCIEYTK